MPDDVHAAYVDKFIIPLLCKVGLTPKVTRKAEYTTIKIPVKRAVQDS
jgi:hypothetical protein